MSDNYALEEASAITIDMAMMFTTRGFNHQDPDVVGIIQVAGSMGQAWGIYENCWRVGPMSLACGQTTECSDGRHQFRPVTFSNNKFAKKPNSWGYSQSISDKNRSAYMYEISTWFIAMWTCEENIADIRVDSLKAKIQFMRKLDDHTLYYYRYAPPGVIDLRHHIEEFETHGQPNAAQAYRTNLLKYVIDPRRTHDRQFEPEMKKTLMEWACRSVLAEKEIVNVTLHENHLLKAAVARLSGQQCEGEEDVAPKHVRVTMADSDDSTGHTRQDNEESPRDPNCQHM